LLLTWYRAPSNSILTGRDIQDSLSEKSCFSRPDPVLVHSCVTPFLEFNQQLHVASPAKAHGVVPKLRVYSRHCLVPI